MLRLLLASLVVSSVAFAQADGGTAAPEASDGGVARYALPVVIPEATGRWTKRALAGKPLWATVKTTKGDFVLRLYSDKSPNTVANFVGLAAGEREWTHPFTLAKTTRPLFDGTAFHRIIPGFMIQGGDPTGTGRGGPGYRFADELSNGLTFDKPGLVAMANYGPNTNGSQFFITVTPPDRLPTHLNGRHTIFGEVASGYDVVQALSNVPVDSRGRPSSEQLTIQKIEISDRAPKGTPAGKSR